MYVYATNLSGYNQVNPLHVTPMSDQYNIKHKSDENKEKYQLGEYWLIQYQILQTHIIRIVK